MASAISPATDRRMTMSAPIGIPAILVLCYSGVRQ
jgi:hypothetical protein